MEYEPIREWHFELTRAMLTLMGSWKTVHTTASLQVGVVREPS